MKRPTVKEFLAAADAAVAKLPEAECRQLLAHLLGDYWRAQDEPDIEDEAENDDAGDDEISFPIDVGDHYYAVSDDIENSPLPCSYSDAMAKEDSDAV
jgi:hypothetical protein